mmetsp:Transcript_21514/g.56090  ORF Transcript_21514/g.56090 Transcript_21514/m.56090 type:complete len:320 (+) Transcript_21514:135-1094(+)
MHAAAVLLVAGGALAADVHIRHPSGTALCLDYAGATDQNPIHTQMCTAGSGSQQFWYDAANGYIHLGGSPSCQEGPPCCLENFFGGSITLWGCSDPSGKKFSYNNMTGQITSQGGCLTAGAPGSAVNTRPCNATNADQNWVMMETAPPPSPPSPMGHSCAAFGCDGAWKPGQSCQCNSDCCAYGNCCPDFHSMCGACSPPPAPPPWPCTPCWRCGNCPPGPAPGTNCPQMAGTWMYAGTNVIVTQEKCAIDARGPARSWQTAIGSFTNEWNIALKVVMSGGMTQTWNGHLNGCSGSSCVSGDTVTWTEPNGVTATWTKQ